MTEVKYLFFQWRITVDKDIEPWFYHHMTILHAHLGFTEKESKTKAMKLGCIG